MSEEDIILWQDVLDSIAGGRTSELTCPFCKTGQIKVTVTGRVTRLECPTCRKFIEGSMQD